MVEFLSSPNAPAWVQAVGSVLAIFVAVLVSNGEARHRREAEKRLMLADQATLANALAAEILSLISREEKIRMIATYRFLAENPFEHKDSVYFDFFEAHQNYTAVYDANAIRLGGLPQDLLIEIVGLYGEIKAMLDSMNGHSELANSDDAGAIAPAANMAAHLARELEALISRARDVAGRLTKLSLETTSKLN